MADGALANQGDQDGYSAKDIQVLEGLEAVRMRPGMYIGSTGPQGLQNMLREVVDNSADEALAGYCTEVNVTVNADGSYSVRDDGRGIPVDEHEKSGISALELVMTTLHAGGKFDQNAYKVSGGLHGVGVSVTNALSEWCWVEVHQQGKIWRQRYELGEPVSKVEVIGETDRTGSITCFKPDRTIMEGDISHEALVHLLREQAFLNKGVTITLDTEATEGREASTDTFLYAGGIVEYVQYIDEVKIPLHAPPIYIEADRDDVIVELAMQYNDSFHEEIATYVNNINTVEGGTHLAGLRAALTTSINTYAQKYNLLKDLKNGLSGEDVRE